MFKRKIRAQYTSAVVEILEEKLAKSSIGQIALVITFLFANLYLKNFGNLLLGLTMSLVVVHVVRIVRRHLMMKNNQMREGFFGANAMRALVLLNGLLWGALLGAAIFHAEGREDVAMLAIFLLGGVCTSSITSLAPSRGLARLFTLLVIAPPTHALFMNHAQLSNVMGVMLVLYFGFLFFQIETHAKGVSRFFESEQHFKALVNATSEAIVLTEGGIITTVNAAFIRTFDCPEEKAIGRSLIDFIAPEDREIAAKQMAGEAAHNVEIRCQRPDGSIFYTSTSGRPIVHEGRFARLSTARDLTEQKRTEESLRNSEQAAIESARLKTEFLANMSHEIRTPLNAIIGVGDLLSELPASDQQKKYHRILTESGNGLLQLINDILDFSKIEAGHIELESIDFSLSTLLENHVELLSQRADQKGLQITASVDPELPALVSGDPGRIGQILLNLMGNAIKFTQEGKIEVRVFRDGTDANGKPRARFEVQDSGIGMSKATCERLFRPFMQADSSMARKFGGTGLGLSICKQLVDLMQGHISVDSVEGSGSTFWFSLPIEPRSLGTIGSMAAQEAILDMSLNAPIQAATSGSETKPGELTPEEEASRVRILVAEDNSTNQILVGAMLSKLGYSYQVVADGAEAVRAFETGKFNLILMDCQMPEVDGFQATRLIRARERKLTTRIPIVALTANATTEDQKRCYDSGMDGFLTKPVRKKQLADTLISFSKSAA